MDPSNSRQAQARFDATRQMLHLAGHWTLGEIDHDRFGSEAFAALFSRAKAIDASGLQKLDTAGALYLMRGLRATGRSVEEGVAGLSEAAIALLRLLGARGQEKPHKRKPHQGFRAMLGRVGAAVSGLFILARGFLGFIGLVLSTLAMVMVGRRKLRATSIVFHMEQTGLDAVPIVALLSFLVGAVVAFLGATVLADFGASIFTVELVSYSFLREFGVLLTAILLAGRSGSAFTAQIGSMKSREEIDAIQVLGMDMVELLVIPRLLALLVMLPALTFVGMIAGIFGGGLVGSFSLDITPGMFISRLHEMTEIRHFWVGMVKAPVFAFVVATVGCLEGLKVEGSAESVGRHTTSSVVQSIFLVILLDALFAIFFMELDI